MIFSSLPFSYEGKFYRSVMPYGDYDPDGRLIKRYQKAGINKVIVLAEDAEIFAQTGRNLFKIYQDHGIQAEHLPIRDFGIPGREQLRSTIEEVVTAMQNGENLVIHCSAGKGRTGLFTACLAKTVLGLNGQEAIQWTREHIPGAIETQEQVEFIMAYNT